MLLKVQISQFFKSYHYCVSKDIQKNWSSTTDIAVMAIVAVSYEREIQWVAFSYDSKPFWTWTAQKNLELWICFSLSLWKTLKVIKFQNEFMKSSFLPKHEPNIVRISALYCATPSAIDSYSIEPLSVLKSDWKRMSLYKWPCYDHFWPFFCHLYVHLSQNWGLDGHFEVLNRSNRV